MPARILLCNRSQGEYERQLQMARGFDGNAKGNDFYFLMKGVDTVSHGSL
jgi:hypothetical protein